MMDRDIEIIEAVRSQPCLYVDNYSIEERNKGWRQLSEKLKIKDQHLKIRWHLLVQRYKNDSNFKYAHQMSFVERKCKSKSQKTKWPEFEITEEDIVDTKHNPEEYIFLDVEDLEVNSALEPKIDIVKEESDVTENQLSNEARNCSSLSTLIAPLEIGLHKCHRNTKTASTPPVCAEVKDNIDKLANEVPTTTARDVSSVLKPAVREEKKNTQGMKSSTERSEDDIFGELVAAMLKRMDADKKRLVKKEIMNMLLT